MSEGRSETVYLHLRPGYWRHDLTVAKMAKSEDVAVEPGDVVVKVKITVPANFFSTARPYAEIALSPEQVVTPSVEQEG